MGSTLVESDEILTPMADQLWTIGHSTRTEDEFLALLTTHGIRRLVDVRRYPFSRRYPHFNREHLAAGLHNAGILYSHEPGLGGRRSARPDSKNLGWRTAGFRGYADYMETEEFQRALEELMAYGTNKSTVILCAEAVPWRCHRQLIADALLARGWTVRHILLSGRTDVHRLTTFALIDHGRLSYPLSPVDPDPPRLL